ncbi:hypothetical protein HpBHB8_13290 [Helicobacter pylori]
MVFTSADKVLNAKLKKLFKEIDWTKYASLATNSCYHLGKSHIFQALHDHLDKRIIDGFGTNFFKNY